jgi:acyl-CoA reductase-like NAD-dependent aldehyde dehydrogenase
VLADFALPAGAPPARIERDERGFASGRWTADGLARLAARLAERGARALASVPVERRLEAWDGALGALLDPESDERRALMPALVATSRLSPEGLTEALDVVLAGWTGEAATRLAARATASGASSPAGVVLAGNVPGLAAQSLLPALVAGRPLLIKSASSEPLFAPALVAALAHREPALGDAFAAVTFAGGETGLARAAFAESGVVLAYGGADALAALAGELGPRLVGQGPKASLAFVAGAVDPVATGRALARDVALLDQRGCLSVQAVWVEGGAADARELAEALAFGLEIAERRLPPGPADAHALGAVQQLRGEAELRDARIGRDRPAAAGTVVLTSEVGFRPSPGLRSVRVHAVARVGDALVALDAWRGRLQGAALAGEGARAIGDELSALGLSRLAEPGRLQSADAAWANGGIDPFDVFG